jgi:hypothetical protein
MYTLMTIEINAMVRPNVVTIKTMPLWFVEVMVASGADWPGSKVVAFGSMTRVLESVQGVCEEEEEEVEEEDFRWNNKVREQSTGLPIRSNLDGT